MSANIVNIVIVNKNKDIIETKLREQLSGYRIEVYPDVHSYYNFLKKSADRADLFIMTDNGIGESIDRGIVAFSDISLYRLFKPKEVLILNRESNTMHYRKYEFVRDDFLERNIDCTIIRKKEITLEDIRTSITDRVQVYNSSERNNRAIIQVRRNSGDIGGKVLEDFSTEGTMLVELNTPTVPTKRIKEQYANNNTPLFENDINEEYIEPLSDMQIPLVEEIVENNVKFIQVSSNSNSGGSTTALILAKSGAEEDKTLLVDLSYSLGLSYLAEMNLHQDEYTEIDLTEMIKSRSDKMNYIEDSTDSETRLHIIRTTLPLIKEVGFGVLQRMVTNILSMVQHKYKYIILDIPFDMVSKYRVISSSVDIIVTVTPPYLSNFVPTLNRMSEELTGTHAYDMGRVLMFIAGIPNLNGLPPISRKTIEDYTNNILGKDIPITAIHISNNQNYVQSHIFGEIIEQGNKLIDREEVYLR